MKLGAPSHYSVIADLHNDLFPDDVCSDEQVRVTLSQEKLGVVWVWLKGTYGLEEWGCFRPTKKLLDAVLYIVSTIHRRTRRPVSFDVIISEIGKYRPVLHLESLRMAIVRNPLVARVGRDSFIPRTEVKAPDSPSNSDELDAILEDFEAELHGA